MHVKDNLKTNIDFVTCARIKVQELRRKIQTEGADEQNLATLHRLTTWLESFNQGK